MELRKHQELLWLEEMEKRGGLKEEGLRELQLRRKGYEGEADFGHLLHDYLPNNWLFIQDLRLKSVAGELQIDALLVNPLGLTVFEVKNYTADYQYSEGSWRVNGRAKVHNDFQQLERTVALLRQLLEQNGFKVPIEKYVVYINEQDSVEIDDPTLPFLKRATLRRFVKEAIKQCQIASNQRYDKESDWLLSQHIDDERRFTLSDDEFASLKKGIYCVNCYTFDVTVSRYEICCRHCQFVEGREKATVRSICDYGLLFPYRDLCVVDLREFIGPPTNYNYILKILAKHFTKKPSANRYINPQLPLDYTTLTKTFYYKDTPTGKIGKH